jgi:hypothetical protein
VLKSIFNMCKTIATETNENRRYIIEIKSHLGLPTDPYRELPEFDDPFAEWDAQVPKKKKKRRAMKKKKRRRATTPSDSAAPHFLFGA